MKQAILKITGTVQGVFYRDSARKMANRLGINGYAHNMPDGSVEILAQGSEEAIENLAIWCQQGPSGASVDNVDMRYQELGETEEGFEIM